MRLVSLVPSVTELLFDLGLGDAVVGRTKFCVHPAEGVHAVEVVGGTKNPKVGRIVALAPDLVFMNEEENRLEDAEALRRAGVPVHSALPRTPDETAAMVRDVARRVRRLARGEAIAREIEVRSARVRALAARARTVRFAYLIWQAPWMTVRDDTFVSSLLEQAGGRNVFAGADARFPVVTAEALVAADPDVILLASEPFPFTPAHAAALAATLGIDASRVTCVDGEVLSWHGSRTPAGIEYAATLLATQRARLAAAG